MPAMDAILRDWIREVFDQHKALLPIAVRQRAKFEGWLKFELASIAKQQGARQVEVEVSYSNGTKRADIGFEFDGTAYCVELKTPNTNWRMPSVPLNKHRPITRNIAGIVRDAKKLTECPKQGIVAFALFPVPPGSRRWMTYLQRIAEEAQVPLSEEKNCFRWQVDLPSEQGEKPEIVVCTFLVNAAQP